MTEATVSMTVRTPTDLTSVIDIDGEVTAASEAALMDAYGRASGDRTRWVVLNFSGLDYMNSSGIGLLVTLLVRANRQKQRLLAFGLTEHYRQIFQLTRLDEAIGIHGSESEAIAAAAA
jgi:anti-sigma B factor antagonist